MSNVQEITIPQETKDALRSNSDHLVLDADILIEAAKHKRQFGDFFTELQDFGLSLTTIEPVILECYNGKQGLQEILRMKEYVESVVTEPLLVKPHRHSGERATLVDPALLAVANTYARKLSFTDYLLIKTLRDYGERVVLLTGNHPDFPLKVLERLGYIEVALEDPTLIWPLGLYQFSEANYGKAAMKLTQ